MICTISSFDTVFVRPTFFMIPDSVECTSTGIQPAVVLRNLEASRSWAYREGIMIAEAAAMAKPPHLLSKTAEATGKGKSFLRCFKLPEGK